MGLGLGFGFLAIALHWEGIVHDWVAPWGTIFMRLLKLIAVPLVLVSLIMGVVAHRSENHFDLCLHHDYCGQHRLGNGEPYQARTNFPKG